MKLVFGHISDIEYKLNTLYDILGSFNKLEKTCLNMFA